MSPNELKAKMALQVMMIRAYALYHGLDVDQAAMAWIPGHAQSFKEGWDLLHQQ